MVTTIAGDWVNPCGLQPSAMSRVAQTLPITPKMYRHFAVVTVVLTAALALFADGERQEMLKGELAKHQTASGAAEQEDPRLAAARARNERAARKSKRAMAGGEAGLDAGDGSFTPDADFSAPMSPTRPAAQGMPAFAGANGAQAFGPDYPMPGMSPEMRRKLSMQKRKQADAPPKLNQQQMDAMLEMSAARSGAGSGDVSD